MQDLVTSLQCLHAQRVRELNSHPLPNAMPNTFCSMEVTTPPNWEGVITPPTAQGCASVSSSHVPNLHPLKCYT